VIRTTLISLIIISVVGGLAGGGMFAYFSDTEESLGNTFEACEWSTNLSIDVGDDWYDDEAPPGGPISPSPFPLFGELPDIKPSHEGAERLSIHFDSVSQDEYDLHIMLRDIDEEGEYHSDENGVIDPEIVAGDDEFSTDGELDEYLKFEFVLEQEAGDPLDVGDNILTPIWDGYASDLTYNVDRDGYPIPNTPLYLDPAEQYWVRVYWHFDETKPGTNICQSDSFSCTLVFATGWYAP
jgi:predicted ribosomally synthesized peptide with SipW-like signal peptide